jgi:hypothetical protein
MKVRIATLLLGLLTVGVAQASWIESSQGDLSNNRLDPSELLLAPGSNLIAGGFGNGDLDYLNVIVPEGYVLSSLVTGLANHQGLSRSFIGVQAGDVMTVPPETGSAVGLLGWTHFGAADGVDLLPGMGEPKFGSIGFFGALGAGSYTFWINETQMEPGLTFDLDFRVTAAPVPVPAAAWLFGSGMVLFGGMVRRRRHRA